MRPVGRLHGQVSRDLERQRIEAREKVQKLAAALGGAHEIQASLYEQRDRLADALRVAAGWVPFKERGELDAALAAAKGGAA